MFTEAKCNNVRTLHSERQRGVHVRRPSREAFPRYSQKKIEDRFGFPRLMVLRNRDELQPGGKRQSLFSRRAFPRHRCHVYFLADELDHRSGDQQSLDPNRSPGDDFACFRPPRSTCTFPTAPAGSKLTNAYFDSQALDRWHRSQLGDCTLKLLEMTAVVILLKRSSQLPPRIAVTIH